MNIIHIASIGNSLLYGTSVAIPQHVKYQSLYEDVVFFNIANRKINGIDNQLPYSKDILEKFLDENHVDLAVFHEVYRFEYIGIARSLNRRKIPYVVIPHGSITHYAQSRRKLKKIVGNILLFNSFLLHSKAIQYLSEREYKSTVFRHPAVVEGNGVVLPEKTKSSFRKEGLHFVYIGRMNDTAFKVKGIDLLIEGINKNKDYLRSSRCVFDLYGPSSENSRKIICNSIQTFELGDLIHIHGPVTGKEKEAVLLDSDIFFQLSRTEGMPMGILEAFSYGLPCLITEGTGMKDIVSQGLGWVVQCDTDSISEGFEKVMNSASSFSDMSKRAVQVIKESFEWSIVAKATLEKYHSLVSENEL